MKAIQQEEERCERDEEDERGDNGDVLEDIRTTTIPMEDATVSRKKGESGIKNVATMATEDAGNSKRTAAADLKKGYLHHVTLFHFGFVGHGSRRLD